MNIEQQPWLEVVRYLRHAAPGESLAFNKDSIGHPREAGARISVGLPAGQLADYRFPAESDCRGLHIREDPGEWVAHLDHVHPDCEVDPLRQDRSSALLRGAAVLGAVFGGAMTKKRSGVLAGAGLGLLAAALLVPTNGEKQGAHGERRHGQRRR